MNNPLSSNPSGPNGDMSALRRKLGAESPQAFAQLYLGRHFSMPGCAMHEWMFSTLAQATVKRGARIAIAAPRDHAKSTIVSLAYLLWSLCYAKEQHVILISGTLDQANAHLENLKFELEQNALLREDFPDVAEPEDSKPAAERWAASEIITRNSIKVTAMGSGGKRLRGLRYRWNRPTLLILDDVETPEQARTREQRQKLVDWLNKTCINALGQNGNLVMVGTILHWDSLLANLLRKDAPWITRKFQAVLPDGSSLWPAKWSPELLAQRKVEIGSLAFEQEFQSNPISPETQIFKLEWIKEWRDLPEEITIFQGVDLAVSTKAMADFFTIVTIGISPAGNIYVLDAFKGHLTFHEQLSKILAFHAMRKPVLVGVESVAYQAVMGQELIRTSNVPVREVRPNKDKVTRAKEISVHLENGKVFLAKGMDDLKDELVEFPLSRHDDLVDALMIAMRLALDWGFGGGIKPIIEFNMPDPHSYVSLKPIVLNTAHGPLSDDQSEDMEAMVRGLLDIPPNVKIRRT